MDFDRRTEDKTNSNILILGNSGQGKSYLMKLLLCNQREAGKSILCLDPEAEYYDLCSNAEVDTIEIMLMKLYARFGIDDFTDFSVLNSEDYPIMSDFYELIEKEFMAFDHEKKHLYTEEMLQNICLGLHSMCKGAESKYFNGYNNIKDGEFICFGMKLSEEVS